VSENPDSAIGSSVAVGPENAKRWPTILPLAHAGSRQALRTKPLGLETLASQAGADQATELPLSRTCHLAPRRTERRGTKLAGLAAVDLDRPRPRLCVGADSPRPGDLGPSLRPQPGCVGGGRRVVNPDGASCSRRHRHRGARHVTRRHPPGTLRHPHCGRGRRHEHSGENHGDEDREATLHATIISRDGSVHTTRPSHSSDGLRGRLFRELRGHRTTMDRGTWQPPTSDLSSSQASITR
jgi:hypothetical protein